MKRIIITLIFSALICAISVAQDRVNSPKIISTIPTFGDCNVDPELTTIVLKFDQDMSPGYSMPNTKNMPQVTGKPVWKDKRTLSIPVKLHQNKLYSLQLNSWKFQGFASIEGIPLNPEDVLFQTKSVSYETLNKKAYNEFKELFPKHYSYASLKGINWESVLETNRAEFENAKTNSEFAFKLIKLLKAAEDLHLWVEVEGQFFETAKMKLFQSNTSSKQLFSLLHDKKASKDFLSITGVVDSVGYISIRDWNTAFDKLVFKPWDDSINSGITAEEALKELFRYPHLIIDVRENSGGNESFAKEFASYFIKDSIPYEKVEMFNEKTGLFDEEYVKKLYLSEKKLTYSGTIYVLSGPAVMSSNESFVLMMKQVPNSKVVGMRTYGSSGNPMPYELSNGVTVYIPSWQAYALDGKLIEGNGIEPDIEIITQKKDFENEDILIDKVLKMIRNK
jgi:hypothetical protein